MWDLEISEEFQRCFKHYEKKRPRELTAVLANLNKVQAFLRDGANPLQIPFGFIHVEQNGVLAIDQKGGGNALAQTRLYIYLEREPKTIHLITLGDKRNQKADIRTSSDYVKELTKRKGQESHDEQEEIQERSRPGEGDSGGPEIR